MSKIKTCFTSRFGDDGVIMEGDWSQLEVVGQAFLSGDERMKQDIRDGVDFHCKRLAYKLGETYKVVYNKVHVLKLGDYIKMRKIIKTFSFQRAYGAGVNAIAESTGMPVAEVKALIKMEEEMYPDVAAYYEMVEEEVRGSRKMSGTLTKGGYPAGVGYFKSITGRVYTFKEFDANKYMLDRGVYTTFSMPQLKNYPVQGFSTADIVPLVLGRLYRELKELTSWKGHVFLINTVHDSIILDVRKEIVPGVALVVKEIMQRGNIYLKDQFDIDFDLPLRAEITYGPSWGSQTEIWSGE